MRVFVLGTLGLSESGLRLRYYSLLYAAVRGRFGGHVLADAAVLVDGSVAMFTVCGGIELSQRRPRKHIYSVVYRFAMARRCQVRATVEKFVQQ